MQFIRHVITYPCPYRTNDSRYNTAQYKQATGLDARESRVNGLDSLCRTVMEYYLLNIHLQVTIGRVITTKSHHIV